MNSLSKSEQQHIASEVEFRKLMTRPKIAWPTIALCVVAVVTFIAACVAAVNGRIPMYTALILNTLCSYISYTVLHEASHGLVSRNRFLNDSVGRIGFVLVTLTPFFRAYRFLHMTHHRHTNDPDKDPDYFCGSGTAWTLPLHWLFMDMAYVTTYFRPGFYSSRPKIEKIDFWASMAFGAGLVAVCVWQGWIVELLVLYLIPTRIAQFALAITFDYLPHVPHNVKAEDNRFGATNNRIGAEWFFGPLCIGQNYHLSHHLYPGAPFYRYRKVWLARQAMHQADKPATVYGWRLFPGTVDASPMSGTEIAK